MDFDWRTCLGDFGIGKPWCESGWIWKRLLYYHLSQPPPPNKNHHEHSSIPPTRTPMIPNSNNNNNPGWSEHAPYPIYPVKLNIWWKHAENPQPRRRPQILPHSPWNPHHPLFLHLPSLSDPNFTLSRTTTNRSTTPWTMMTTMMTTIRAFLVIPVMLPLPLLSALQPWMIKSTQWLSPPVVDLSLPSPTTYHFKKIPRRINNKHVDFADPTATLVSTSGSAQPWLHSIDNSPHPL